MQVKHCYIQIGLVLLFRIYRWYDPFHYFLISGKL